MMGHGGDMGVGWMIGGGIMMFGFWAALIGLVAWAVTRIGRDGRALDRSGTPLEILQRRYASGEISQEEFDTARRALV